MTLPIGKRLLIENIAPTVANGRFPVKRVIGDVIQISADIIMHQHGLIGAVIRYQKPGDPSWHVAMLGLQENDRWEGSFELTELGRYRFTIEAWPDHFATWERDTEAKRKAGQKLDLELADGLILVKAAVECAKGALKKSLTQLLKQIERAEPDAQYQLLLSPDLRLAMGGLVDPAEIMQADHIYPIEVERVEARFGAWYEMFLRSQGHTPGKSATFDDGIARLAEIRDLGFDVVYLPPIHPIGKVNRKGRDNALKAVEGDPGSPYAIQNHKEIEPQLGALADFRRFVAAANALDMEIALDFAVQASPDHFYLTEHPEWFKFRADGSIKYAENPPKKYEDIVNVEFFGPHAEALWEELRSIILFWLEQGVKIFRVDNPHTKPLPFWEWLIRSVKEIDPEVIFLAEAFTRPKMMQALAKLGFSQSYSYFTWRNTKDELTEYMVELSDPEMASFYRPNFFANTPDILPSYLQTSGRPGFIVRATLAATLSPTYGIYNGFELCEAEAILGHEEYAHSEKYEFKVWDWNRPGHIKDHIRRLNKIRRQNPAFHRLDNIRFHPADNDQILFYVKATEDHHNIVFVVVNLDPHTVQETYIELPLEHFGIAVDAPYRLDDLLLGHTWEWQGVRKHQRLDPSVNPVAIFRLHLVPPRI